MRIGAKAAALCATLCGVIACEKSAGIGPDTLTPDTGFGLEPAFLNLTFSDPVDIDPVPGTQRLAVVEATGRIKVFDNDLQVEGFNTYLDLTGLVSAGGPGAGLISLSFHPDFVNNGWLFIYYSTGDRTVLARYVAASPDATSVSSSTRLVILEIVQPDSAHNGGGLAFGADGNLYLGVGDGGPVGDPDRRGQDLGSLLGSVLRLDVSASSSMEPYRIPAGNPFDNGDPASRPEIWVWGVRDPDHLAFDAASGFLLATDAGGSRSQELNQIRGPANLGWSVVEGSSCYRPPTGCDPGGFQEPFWEYGSGSQPGVIVGGGTYTGTRSPQLAGHYLLADGIAGDIWALTAASGLVQVMTLDRSPSPIVVVGLDQLGEPIFGLEDGSMLRLTNMRP